MRGVSGLLHLSYASLSAVNGFRLWPDHDAGKQAAVVTYHGVQPAGYQRLDPFLDGNLVSTEALRQHVRLLKARYCLLAPEDFRACLAAGNFPPRSVLVTCDDGHLNNLTHMASMFSNEGVKAMFFVTSDPLSNGGSFLWHECLELVVMTVRNIPGRVSLPDVGEFEFPNEVAQRRAVLSQLIAALSPCSQETKWQAIYILAEKVGGKAWLDELLARNDGRFRVLNARELLQLADLGMTIGSHTVSHPRLAVLPGPAAEREIKDSRERIHEVLNEEVWAIAYPFGDAQAVGAREFQLAREAGYECGFLNYGGKLNAGQDKFALFRAHIGADVTPGTLDALASGFHDKLKGLLQRKQRSSTGDSQLS